MHQYKKQAYFQLNHFCLYIPKLINSYNFLIDQLDLMKSIISCVLKTINKIKYYSISNSSKSFQDSYDQHINEDQQHNQSVKPYHLIPGVTSLPIIGTSWSYMPYFGEQKVKSSQK